MKRSTAREIATHFSYEMSVNDMPAEELLAARLNCPEYYDTLSEEDSIYSEVPDTNSREYICSIVTGVSEHSAELDGYIEKYAIGWKFSRISRVAAAIMRVCMYEILYMQDVPDSAAVNDAVEIAKKYEPEETVAFINGILGTFIREEKK